MHSNQTIIISSKTIGLGALKKNKKNIHCYILLYLSFQ